MLHIKSIRPRYTTVITTADRYTEDAVTNGIITDSNATKGRIKWNQTVVAVGPMVRDLQPGDKVMLNPEAFAVRKYSKGSVQNDMDNNPVTSYQVPVVTIEDEEGNPVEQLYIDENSIQYAYEGEETAGGEILIPEKPKIIIN